MSRVIIEAKLKLVVVSKKKGVSQPKNVTDGTNSTWPRQHVNDLS